jgi:threonine aldolase
MKAGTTGTGAAITLRTLAASGEEPVRIVYSLRAVIDLRSDTKTLPSEGMRRAMANAEVGDEQRREDPTVLELERRVAELLGQEDSVYLPTATMANQIALAILAERGTELIVEQSAHIMISELGGAARFSGIQTHGVTGTRGLLTPEQVRAAYAPGDAHHWPRTTVLALENTHNTGGGKVWPLDQLRAVVETGRELGLKLHLDGARLLNASVATGVPAAEMGRLFDTVQICLSKGLGCPLGALIAGSHELMVMARREKHAFGGAMRQAGIVAAAGLYALDHNVERLADDHARARRLAAGLYERSVPVDPSAVETNFVQVRLEPLGLTESEALQRLWDAGVGLSITDFGVLRAVTHLGVDDDDIERAVELIPQALGALARA